LGYKKKLEQVDEAILVNAKFLDQIVANPEIFGHDLTFPDEDGDTEQESDGHHHDGEGTHPISFDISDGL
jgi:carnosine N-methyltransferase